MTKESITSKHKYATGMLVYAKSNRHLKLLIKDYKKRLYFCVLANYPDMKQFTYFERELIHPRDR